MNNIDKKLFNERFKQYLNGSYVFSNQLYKDLKAICYNVTYTHEFSEVQTYEDTESELILFTLTKCQYLKDKGNTTTNYYNLVFSMVKRKFLDILRAKNRIKKGIRVDLDVYSIKISYEIH
jgi:hypothetical protein